MPNSKIIRTTPETQGNSGWTPPLGTLGELVEQAWLRSEKLDEVRLASSIQRPRSVYGAFARALRREAVAIIAEVKRASPSKGSINPAIDAADRAGAYASGGAAALSVLTEPTRFGGSNDDLTRVLDRVSIPVLKKDFHVSERQLHEAAVLGASAALVIVRAVEPSQLPVLATTARRLLLEIVYEVRDESELSRALDAGAEIIGVNNRNLETLEIDKSTVPRIIPLIPPACIAIAESGYESPGDLDSAARAGADAVLVGSSLSASDDPAEAVRIMSRVSRHDRQSR